MAPASQKTHNPETQRANRLRLSLSTRIFLAFALVVACTGAASLYAIAAVAALRHELTFLRQSALPLLDELRQTTTELRSFDEALQRAAPQDMAWVVRLLPNARPYGRVDDLLRYTRQLALRTQPPPIARLVVQDRLQLPLLDAQLNELRTTNTLRQRMAQDAELSQAAGKLATAPTDAAAYEVLVGGLQRAIADRRLDDAARLVVEIRRMMRHVHVALEKSLRQLQTGLTDRFEDAERSERYLLAVVGSTAALNLLVSVLMLLASVVALRPLAALTGVVRQFASGDRKARASTRGANEISTLADEWNRMADALAQREDQLLAQREELARAEQLASLGHMAARMAHEVRNPLSSIGLNAELLGDELAAQPGGPPSEAAELLAAIGGEVERLRQLTESYLDRARPAPGQVRPVDLAKEIAKLLDFLAPELELRQVRVRSRLQPGLWVAGDAAALRQALWNLVRNAWEAMPDGGPLWLDLQEAPARAGSSGPRDQASLQDNPEDDELPQLPAEACAEISVEDGGQGVAEPIQLDIFKPFFTSKASGTGMGLAVVQQIARQHRGQVQLQPGRHGKGARFVLILPLCAPHSAATAPQTTEDSLV